MNWRAVSASRSTRSLLRWTSPLRECNEAKSSATGRGWCLGFCGPGFFRRRHRLAKRTWPACAAVAEHARRLPDLAVGNHVAADAGVGRARLLCALPDALPDLARPGRRAGRGRDGAVERPGLLHPRAQSAQVRAARRRGLRWRVPSDPALLAELPGIGRS